MSRNYKFHNPEGVYFVSFAVVNWLEIFNNNDYKNIILESLKFCQHEKGMEIFAWCIMNNHVHLVFRDTKNFKPEQLLGDLKRFTSNKLIKAIKENSSENHRDFFMKHFKITANKSSNVNQYQVWQHDNHPIELWSKKVIAQKINYIHNNPVEADYVKFPEEYLYSSARDYFDEKGLLEGIIIVK